MTDVSVVHCDVKIDYNERNDNWTFSLRGRERSAESLTKAKEAIDRIPKEKNVFQRIPVFCFEGYSNTKFAKGKITSIAESRYTSTPEVWITVAGDRKKVYASNTFPITAQNSATISNLETMRAKINELEDAYKEEKRKLIAYVIPKDDSL